MLKAKYKKGPKSGRILCV